MNTSVLQPIAKACAHKVAHALAARQDDIRSRFPIFANQPEVAFFDNASTSQKPQTVIDCVSEFYSKTCSNAGRAAYRWSTRASQSIEDARAKVAELLNASASEIAFTSGATESLNLVALSWGLNNLRDGDEVMLCYEDHKSAVHPWLNVQRLLKQFGTNITIVPFSMDVMGDYHFDDIRAKVSPRTRVIAICHIHHVYGLDMEVKGVREIVGPDVLISLDASQSVGHTRVDVKHLGVDFLSFSGHKMFAANGSGVLWLHPRVHSQMSPIKVGGGGAGSIVAGSFNCNGTIVQELLECGTQNIPAIMSLSPAVELIQEYGIDYIEARVSYLTRYLFDRLRLIPDLEFAPGLGRCNCPGGFGIISFSMDNISATDLSFVLDNENIFVRTGDHCRSKHDEDDVRVSLHCYNTEDEIDRLIEVLKSLPSS